MQELEGAVYRQNEGLQKLYSGSNYVFRSKHQLNRMLQQKTKHVQSQSKSIFLETFW